MIKATTMTLLSLKCQILKKLTSERESKPLREKEQKKIVDTKVKLKK